MLRALYNDNKELKRAVLNGLFALFIIVGSIVGKTGFTYATLALIVLSIFGLALVDTWNAVLLFIVYLALEGMYKYSTDYNTVVYVMAPLLCATIFVAWRIRSRSEAEKREAQGGAAELSKSSPFRNLSAAEGVGLPKIATVIFALIALSLLQSANPESPGLLTSLNGAIVWYIGPMSFFFVSYYTLRYRKDVMGFAYTLLVVGFVVSAYAIFQFYMGKQWVDQHVPGVINMGDQNYTVAGANQVLEGGAYRPPSTAATYAGYVVFSCIGVLTALCVSAMPSMATWRRTLALLSISVLTMGLVLSGVRQVVLNLCFVAPTMLLLGARRFEETIRLYFMSFLLGGILLVSFVVADNAAGGKLSKRYGTVFSGDIANSYARNRGTSLELIPQAIAVRPFGIGINRSTRGGLSEGSSRFALRGAVGVLKNRETQWNAIQADLGVFGLISLIVLFAIVIHQGAAICRRLSDPNLRAIGCLMFAIILFNFVASLGSAALQSNYIFWSACGILFALPRIAVSERKLLAEGSGLGVGIPVKVAG